MALSYSLSDDELQLTLKGNDERTQSRTFYADNTTATDRHDKIEITIEEHAVYVCFDDGEIHACTKIRYSRDNAFEHPEVLCTKSMK